MPMPSSRVVGRIAVSMPRLHQRIFDLQIGDRMHRMGASDRLGADFRQPDMPDVTGADHVGDGADRVLDWHCRIEPGRAIDVDMIGAEPAQRVGEEVLHRGRAGVVCRANMPAGSRSAPNFTEMTTRSRGTPSSARRISISLWPMP